VVWSSGSPRNLFRRISSGPGEEQDRAEVDDRIRRGELAPWAYPLHLRQVSNRDQGWREPVPVCSMANYSGPKCTRTFCDFLPAGAVGFMPETGMQEELERGLEDRSQLYVLPGQRLPIR
jgi:hypothetical protein